LEERVERACGQGGLIAEMKAEPARRIGIGVAVAVAGLAVAIAVALFLPKDIDITFDAAGHPLVFGMVIKKPNLHRAMIRTLDNINFRMTFHLPRDLSRDAMMTALPAIDQAIEVATFGQNTNDWRQIQIAALQTMVVNVSKELEEGKQLESNLKRSLSPPPPSVADPKDEAAYAAVRQRNQQLVVCYNRICMQLEVARMEGRASSKK